MEGSTGEVALTQSSRWTTRSLYIDKSAVKEGPLPWSEAPKKKSIQTENYEQINDHEKTSRIVAILIAGGVSTQSAEKQELEAAKQAYEQAAPLGNEAARVAYVTKLAQIADRLVTGYRKGDRGDQHQELIGAVRRSWDNC